MKSSETNSRSEYLPTAKRDRRALMAAGSAVVAAAFLTLPRLGADLPAPEPTFSEQIESSAQIPQTEDDAVAIDTIAIDPTDSGRNSASEVVEASEEVDAYLASNPDEEYSIDVSSNTVPPATEYSVVERDVDGDGDTDAIVVPKG
jgi:hypothetical protein